MKDVKLGDMERHQFGGLNIDIKAQSKVALIVPSHRKSIIADILTRSIDIENGRVLIDGQNIN